MRRLGLPGLIAPILAGCNPAEPAHDKACHLAHTDDHGAMSGRCRNDPGGVGKSADCASAPAAAGAAGSNRFWNHEQPRSRVENPGGL